MQAIRTALNRAYGVERGMSFWGARIKVTLFTVIGGVGTVLAFGSVIVMPYVWSVLETHRRCRPRSAVVAQQRALRRWPSSC